MVNTNTVLSSILFSQTIDWNIKQFFNSTTIKSTFEMKRIGKAITRCKDQMVVEDSKKYKRITIKTNCGGVVVRDEVLGEEIKTKNQYYIKAGQLAVSKIDARNGAFGIVPPEADGAIITGNFWVYDVNPEVANIEYLVLLLSSNAFVQAWQDCSNGSGNRLYLQEDKFLNYKIPMPVITKQHSIIKQFEKRISEANDVIAETEYIKTGIFDYLTKILGIVETESQTIKTFSTVKYSMVDKWGVDFLTSGRVIHNKKFPTKLIGSICDSGSGGTPSRSVESYYGGNIPWVKTGEVLDDIIYDTEEKITRSALNNSSAKLYPKGSIVIAMYGQGLTRGRTAKLGIDATTNQACLVLYNIDTDKILPDYLWYYLQGEYHRLRALAYGNNQPNLNAGIINNYPIVIPPIKSEDPSEVTQTTIVNEIVKRKQQIKELNIKANAFKMDAQKLFEEAVFGEA